MVYNISLIDEQIKKSNENIIKIEEDNYYKELKDIQNKEANVNHQQQPLLKRPDSAKYLPPNKQESPKPNQINNHPNNNIVKQNPQPIIKNNLPISNNNNIYQQKQQQIIQNNVNNNILMRNDKPQTPIKYS